MYWIASPFSTKNNGISNYCENAKEILCSAGINSQIITNEEGLNVVEFEKKITSLISPQDHLEIPDAWGLFSKSKPACKLHTRMHAPSLYLQQLNGTPENKIRFSRELAAIYNADYISSPSVANSLKYTLDDHKHVNHFPNPIIANKETTTHKEKDIDIIFIGRFDKVKGADYLYNLLWHLPPKTKVAIVGIDTSEAENYLSACQHIDVDFHGWIDNSVKDQLLSRSKICAILSRFESFSLVCFEAIVKHAHVVSWHVGGIPECFPKNFVTTIKEGNILAFAAACAENLEHFSSKKFETTDFINQNNLKFTNGIIAFIEGRRLETNSQLRAPEYGSIEKINLIKKDIVSRFFSAPKMKILGYSMMNEHAEQMWGAAHSLFDNYNYVSRKPLGYNNKFDENFPIDSDKYFVYDWRFETARLSAHVKTFSPDMIFVFNGNNSHFDLAKSNIEQDNNTPFVFSELGWLPQYGHIYFDAEGANHKSRFGKSTLEDLVGDIKTEELVEKDFQYNKVLLALQLPGDTTLSPESFPKQYSHEDFISVIRTSIPKHFHLVVRKHPRDTNTYNLQNLENTSFDLNSDGETSLKEVDVVISVNSTFLFEALKYEVNAYHFGLGVISNKGVALDCTEKNIDELWLSKIKFSKTRREILLSYMKKRQFNVSNFHKNKDPASYADSLYPLIESKLEHDARMVIPVKQPASPTNKNLTKNTTPTISQKHKKLGACEKLLHYANDKKLANNFLFNILMKVPAFRFRATKNLMMEPIKNKKIGIELDNEFKKIRNIQKVVPEKTFIYYRAKWVYYGLSKPIINFSKSQLINKLNISQKMDVAAILCEGGAYAHALDLAKECLKSQPSIFRKKQYLRLSHLVAMEAHYLNSLPEDEATYISRLNECFERVNKDQSEFIKYLQKHKHSFAIIGNSPNSRGTKLGKEINTKSMVARFNSYDISLEKRTDVGQKTNVWIKSPTFEEVSRKLLHNLDVVMVTGTNHLDRSPSAYDFFRDFLPYKNLIIGITPPELYTRVSTELSAPPSGGIQFLSLLKEVSGKIQKDNISGFSFSLNDALKGVNGEANQKLKYNHNWAKEVDYIAKRITA